VTGGPIPRRYETIVFGFLLTGMMSLLVSGISTVRAVGFDPGLARLLLGSWLSSWAVAFPAVLVVTPLVRKIVARVVRRD
jgi:hypothetical protein